MKYSKPLEIITSRLLQAYSAEPNAARPIASELLSLVVPVSNLEKMAKTQNPMDTPQAHAKKVAAAGEKLAGSVDRSGAKLAQIQNEAIARLNSEIDSRSRLTPTADAAEIRSVLRTMDAADRMKAVNRAVKSGDAATLAAIAEGSPLTTGLDSKMTGRILDAYREQQAPELFAELKQVKEISDSVPKVLDLAMKAANSALNPQFISEILEAESNAIAAAQEFETSLSQ